LLYPLSYEGRGRGPRARPKSTVALMTIMRLTGVVHCHTLYDMATKRASRVLTVSVPPETAEDFERIAEDEGRNRSELFREMLRVYRTYLETRTFESLQRYGAAQASRKGVKTERDVERLIQESRG
jgi:ribbon-helix-helix CopG family protein